MRDFKKEMQQRQEERINNANRMKPLIKVFQEVKDDANCHIEYLIEASTCMQILSLIIGADETHLAGSGWESKDFEKMPHQNLKGDEHKGFLDAITLYHTIQQFTKALKGTMFENEIPGHLDANISLEERWNTIDAFPDTLEDEE